MTLSVVDEGGAISSFRGTEHGAEGDRCPGTSVADAIVQDADNSSASDFGLPVVGEASSDFSAPQSASPDSRPGDFQESEALVPSVEIAASLLDGGCLLITLYVTR